MLLRGVECIYSAIPLLETTSLPLPNMQTQQRAAARQNWDMNHLALLLRVGDTTNCDCKEILLVAGGAIPPEVANDISRSHLGDMMDGAPLP